MTFTKHTATDYYICKRLRLLDFLMKQGFEVIDTVPDVKNPKYKCWRFKRTPEILEAVEQYYSTDFNN